MPFSFTQTRNQIIRRVLRIAGVVAQGEEPTPEQLIEADECLSVTLKAFSNDGVILWKQVERRIDFPAAPSIVANNGRTYLCIQTHTADEAVNQPGLGTDWHLYWKEHSESSETAWTADDGGNPVVYTGTAVIAIPNDVISIEKLWSVQNQSEIGIQLVNRWEFLSRPYRYTTGTPTTAWFEASENPRLHLDYSSIDTTFSLRYLAQLMIDSFVGAGDTQDTPAQWLDAITYAVASQLADEYQLPLDERSYLTQKAVAKIRAARGATRDVRTSSFIRSAY